MKKLLLAVIVSLTTISSVALAEIKVGIILGFTGPIETLTPAMRDSAKLAFAEVSSSGALLGGETITPLIADSTCVDSDAAVAAAEILINDGVVAIMGADCSGVTGAIATNVAVPNGVTMVSPSATSPGLTKLADNGLFFRTAPSDAKGGQVLAQVALDRGLTSVAVTYTNNDYGKGLADVFEASFSSGGGTVTAVASHEDGKADYSAEVGVLGSAGGDALVVIGYLDQGGKGMIQASLDSGSFDLFVLSDGMIGQSIADAIGADLNGSFGTLPGTQSEGAAKFAEISGDIDPTAPYAGESYDAAALIALAIEAGGSADRSSIVANIKKVANAPGDKILPGELAKGLAILAGGGDVDYQGATDVELSTFGDAAGSFKEMEVKGGSFELVQVRQ
ncbi:MAG: ABC transporter substrate-binding protein [Pelagibacteraceae bacterium]|jgi:branched-chain amino acid transport system substrate-binding protein|nr:ABC transporter substrate-binding protein [Pelagibacteraceae bacterium]HJL58084.1 ABC transporter substrate-binding protein [Alphaproteobacteria bacterium]MBO6468143.1 ABC transporter substrate-binding protein [Pelagibacteraceae bacterium]MBO6469343.1 ABC transporter substrate-binding protein [Pelagibacteraceae bacterium]MBO6470374.1 ABC transporter substrate-binding protein [Pelagibacteraceae bacterium]